jgi:hypothetical protein
MIQPYSILFGYLPQLKQLPADDGQQYQQIVY